MKINLPEIDENMKSIYQKLMKRDFCWIVIDIKLKKRKCLLKCCVSRLTEIKTNDNNCISLTCVLKYHDFLH